MASFSKRYGYEGEKLIIHHEGLPLEIRGELLKWILKYVQIDNLLLIVCELILKIVPNSKFYNSASQLEEISKHVFSWEWHRTYVLLEEVAAFLNYKDENLPPQVRKYGQFESDVNQFFIEHGIGWQLANRGEVLARSDEGFESTVQTAVDSLEEDNRPTAKKHLKNSINALSARPHANTSGAVAHATSAVECILGEIVGSGVTLGDYLKKSTLFHPCLKKSLEGIYGYASDTARHGKEGVEPSREDAEFVIATCAATCTLLTKRHPK